MTITSITNPDGHFGDWRTKFFSDKQSSFSPHGLKAQWSFLFKNGIARITFSVKNFKCSQVLRLWSESGAFGWIKLSSAF
jgi:hypothetical protein